MRSIDDEALFIFANGKGKGEAENRGALIFCHEGVMSHGGGGITDKQGFDLSFSFFFFGDDMANGASGGAPINGGQRIALLKGTQLMKLTALSGQLAGVLS